MCNEINGGVMACNVMSCDVMFWWYVIMWLIWRRSRLKLMGKHERRKQNSTRRALFLSSDAWFRFLFPKNLEKIAAPHHAHNTKWQCCMRKKGRQHTQLVVGTGHILPECPLLPLHSCDATGASCKNHVQQLKKFACNHNVCAKRMVFPKLFKPIKYQW